MAYTVVNSSYNFFKSLTYEGTGSTQSISGINFKPDFVWVKDRDNARSHELYDSVRGATKRIQSDNDGDESTQANNLTAFQSNGFQVGTGAGTNASSQTFSAWSWNCDAAASATYTVKVVSDSGNKYRFNDFGTSAVTLDLEEGGTYTFDGSDSSMASHPIKLSTTANGTHGGGSSYNTGVTYLLDGSSVTESAYVSGYASATTRKLQITVAASAPTLYYYCHYHSGMGGQANTNATRGSSNFGGTIQSRAVFATAPGISVVTYTGTGSAGTVGHGLGVAPDLVLIKKRDGGSDAGWLVYHTSLGNATGGRLDVDNGNALSGSDLFNSTSPTTNNFSIGTNFRCNDSGSTYVAYCFASIKGFSHIGSYQGTAIADNGPFVNTGFKPGFIIVKNFPDGEHWRLYDMPTNPGYNKNGYYVIPSDPGAQTNNQSTGRVDVMAGGFKVRGTGGFINGDGDTHIYWAFAQNPFVGGGIPATAL